MQPASNEFEDWGPCSPGFLVDLSKQAKAKSRRRAAVRVGVIAIAVVCAVSLGAWRVGRLLQPREFYFAGIACHDVQANMDAYLAGTLPEDLTTQIENHLRECDACRQLMQQMQAILAVAERPHQFELACDCSDCRRHATVAVLAAVRSADGATSNVVAASFIGATKRAAADES